MKFSLPATALLVAFLGTSCTKQQENSRPFTIQKVNSKYKLTCLLSGETVSLDGNHNVQAISSVTLRDESTGRELRFQPDDPTSLYQSQGYFTEVWSPDQEYLALPLGRFEGFALYKSTDVMRLLASHKSTDSIRIQMQSGTRLWHIFKAWRGDSSLKFEAGLDNEYTPFRYALATRILSATPSTATSFVGINATGEVPLSPLTSDVRQP
jgi:hypothetical protein